jgi:hypothetical protein
MTPMIDTRKLKSVPTVATRLGISRQAVYNAIANGWLDKVEIDGTVFVMESSILRYKRSRRPRGPKAKQ